jgi:Tfp pilus assembly protein PilF
MVIGIKLLKRIASILGFWMLGHNVIASPKSNVSSEESRQELKDAVSSTKDFSRIIKSNPMDEHAYVQRGWAYRKLARYADALADLDKALQIQPKSSKALCKRAWIYNDLGYTKNSVHFYIKAVRDATNSIRLDPDNWDAYDARAFSYGQLKQDQQANQDAQRSIQLQMKRTHIH